MFSADLKLRVIVTAQFPTIYHKVPKKCQMCHKGPFNKLLTNKEGSQYYCSNECIYKTSPNPNYMYYIRRGTTRNLKELSYLNKHYKMACIATESRLESPRKRRKLS